MHAEILPGVFQYDCDTYPVERQLGLHYDNGAKQRVVTGVNVAESCANTAVRLNAANIEWINGLYK